MILYQSKPTQVEAVQWTGRNFISIHLFGCDVEQRFGGDIELLAGKDGSQGMVPVPVGHWIVRNPGDRSDYWPVDPEYFASKYEIVSGDGAA